MTISKNARKTATKFAADHVDCTILWGTDKSVSLASIQRQVFNMADQAQSADNQASLLAATMNRKYGGAATPAQKVQFAHIVAKAMQEWRAQVRAKAVSQSGQLQSWADYGTTKAGKPADPVKSGTTSAITWCRLHCQVALSFNVEGSRAKPVDFVGGKMPLHAYAITDLPVIEPSKETASGKSSDKSSAASDAQHAPADKGASLIEQVVSDKGTAKAALLAILEAFPQLTQQTAVKDCFNDALAKTNAAKAVAAKRKAKAAVK